MTETYLVENVPLPVVGGTLQLEDGVPLLQGTVLPDPAIHLGKTSLSYHIPDVESVLVKNDSLARFEDGERSVEADITRVLSWVRLEILYQLVMSCWDVGLNWS